MSGADGSESILDLLIVQEKGNELLYLNGFTCAGGGISNHHSGKKTKMPDEGGWEGDENEREARNKGK